MEGKERKQAGYLEIVFYLKNRKNTTKLNHSSYGPYKQIYIHEKVISSILPVTKYTYLSRLFSAQCMLIRE